MPPLIHGEVLQGFGRQVGRFEGCHMPVLHTIRSGPLLQKFVLHVNVYTEFCLGVPDGLKWALPFDGGCILLHGIAKHDGLELDGFMVPFEHLS